MQEFREGRGELLAEYPRVLLWIPFKCISPVNQFFNRSSFRRDRREFSWRKELQNLHSKLPIMVGGSLEVRQRLVDQVLGQGGDKSSSKRSESV